MLGLDMLESDAWTCRLLIFGIWMELLNRERNKPVIYKLVIRFRKECPDGKLTRHHLRSLFQKVFPDGEVFEERRFKLNRVKEMPPRLRRTSSGSLTLMEMTSWTSRSS